MGLHSSGYGTTNVIFAKIVVIAAFIKVAKIANIAAIVKIAKMTNTA